VYPTNRYSARRKRACQQRHSRSWNLAVTLPGTDTYSLNPANQRFGPFNIAHTFDNISSLTTNFWNRGFLTPNSARAVELLAANGFPAALTSFASIGPRGDFGKGNFYGMLFSFGPQNGGTRKHHQGNFQFGQINYFGFKFAIAGEDHYGWVRILARGAARARTRRRPRLHCLGISRTFSSSWFCPCSLRTWGFAVVGAPDSRRREPRLGLCGSNPRGSSR